MSLDPLVLVTARDHGRAALAAATPDDARAAVLALFDHHASAAVLDGEPLVYAGIVVGQAGHGDLDADVARFREGGDPRHAEIAAWFLSGYWRFVRRPAGSLLAALAADLDRLDRASSGWMATAMALTVRVALDTALPERGALREKLLRHLPQLELRRLHPGLAGEIARLRTR